MRLSPARPLDLIRRLLCALWLVVVSNAHAVAQQSPGEAERNLARALGAQGIEAFWAGDLELANDKLQYAYQLYQVPTLGLFSARALERKGLWVEAVARYRETLRLSADVGDSDAQREAQKEAEAELAKLLPRLPSLALVLENAVAAQASVTLDQEPLGGAELGVARPANPGRHRAVVRYAEQQLESVFDLAEGEVRTVTLTFDASRTSQLLRDGLIWHVLSLALLLAAASMIALQRLRRRRRERAAAERPSSTPSGVPGAPSLRDFRALIPDEFEKTRDAISELLATFFQTGVLFSPGVIQLRDPHLQERSHYDYFALLIPQSQPDSERSLLETRVFVSCAGPLESELAKLPRARRKVVLAISDAMELGRGVHVKIREYRTLYDALVVPLHLGEIQLAHRKSELRELFHERISALHTSEDPYADDARPDPARIIGMHREVQSIVGALARPKCLVAIDGLPGSGKSSLVKRVAYELEEPFTYVRCESFQPRTFCELAQQITRELRVPAAESSRTLAESFAALQASLQRSSGRSILVLEDADWLLRPLHDHVSSGGAGEWREFWHGLYEHGIDQGLRVIVVATRAFALCQRSIGDWDNPLAKITVRGAVPPLDFETTERLISGPGAQMNLQFEPQAIRLIFQETAGNIQLIRRICSDIVRRSQSARYSRDLQYVSIRAKHARRSIRAQAAGTSATGARVLPWLSALERSVLHAIACVRPSDIDALREVLPDADGEAIRGAVDRLVELQLIDEAFRVRIPLLQRWMVAYFGEQPGSHERQQRRKFTWVAVGALATLVLAAGYYSLSPRLIAEPSAGGNGCTYTVLHPDRVILNQKFTIAIRADKSCGAQPIPKLSLSPGRETMLKASSAVIPVDMSHGAAEVEVTIAFGTTSSYELELRDANRSIAVIRMGTDWLATLGGGAETLTRTLVAIPTMLGIIATFFNDLRMHLGRIAGALGTRRSRGQRRRLDQRPSTSSAHTD